MSITSFGTFLDNRTLLRTMINITPSFFKIIISGTHVHLNDGISMASGFLKRDNPCPHLWLQMNHPFHVGKAVTEELGLALNLNDIDKETLQCVESQLFGRCRTRSAFVRYVIQNSVKFKGCSKSDALIKVAYIY